MTRPGRKDRPDTGARLAEDRHAAVSLTVILTGLAYLGAPELPGPVRALLCLVALVVAVVDCR